MHGQREGREVEIEMLTTPPSRPRARHSKRARATSPREGERVRRGEVKKYVLLPNFQDIVAEGCVVVRGRERRAELREDGAESCCWLMMCRCDEMLSGEKMKRERERES